MASRLCRTVIVSNVGFGKDATHTTGRSINTMVRLGIDPISTHPFYYVMLRQIISFDCHFGGKWQRFPLSLFRLPRKAAALTFHAMKRVFGFFHH